MQPLIRVEDLAVIRDDLSLCDLRWDLIDPSRGRETYERGHIPGAVFVDLDSDLTAPPGIDGRHPLPTPAEFATTLGRLGISPDRHVVAYDDNGGRIAARLWWMLRSIGHERIQVLDGGYQAWVEAGFDVGVGTVTPTPAHYPVPGGFEGVATHEALGGRRVVDARAAERYRGEFEPVDPKAGHIPGAINIPSDLNLDDRGLFRPPVELFEIYQDLTGDTVVSCGSGVTACHTALAMATAGLSMPDVYVGSFSEWSRRDMPVHTGAEP
jgi:thiosulfate/3-mercaptopyruvate sulfurtransferase